MGPSKWRGGVPSSVLLGFLRPVRGCVEPSITPWERVRVLEKKLLLFLWDGDSRVAGEGGLLPQMSLRKSDLFFIFILHRVQITALGLMLHSAFCICIL